MAPGVRNNDEETTETAENAYEQALLALVAMD
jgi:hypothetical protein